MRKIGIAIISLIFFLPVMIPAVISQKDLWLGFRCCMTPVVAPQEEKGGK